MTIDDLHSDYQHQLIHVLRVLLLSPILLSVRELIVAFLAPRSVCVAPEHASSFPFLLIPLIAHSSTELQRALLEAEQVVLSHGNARVGQRQAARCSTVEVEKCRRLSTETRGQPLPESHSAATRAVGAEAPQRPAIETDGTVMAMEASGRMRR